MNRHEPKYWTPDKLRFIAENLLQMGHKGLAKHFGCSRTALSTHVSKMRRLGKFPDLPKLKNFPPGTERIHYEAGALARVVKMEDGTWRRLGQVAGRRELTDEQKAKKREYDRRFNQERKQQRLSTRQHAEKREPKAVAPKRIRPAKPLKTKEPKRMNLTPDHSGKVRIRINAKTELLVPPHRVDEVKRKYGLVG